MTSSKLPNFIIPGFYRMRNGAKAEVFAVRKEGDEGTLWLYGRYQNDNRDWLQGLWWGNGENDPDTPSELVEPWQEPVAVDGWVNVYPTYLILNQSAHEAKLEALEDCIATLHIRYTNGVILTVRDEPAESEVA